MEVEPIQGGEVAPGRGDGGGGCQVSKREQQSLARFILSSPGRRVRLWGLEVQGLGFKVQGLRLGIKV